VEQHDAIARLTFDYAFFNDTFRVDELVELFAPDAVLDFTRAGLSRLEGRDSIRDFFERERRAVTHLMHVTTNHRLDVGSDTATGTVYFTATAAMSDGRENTARGYYDDAYVRRDGSWRFAARVIVPLLPFEAIRSRK
jgi:hypothetical protein